LRPVDFVEYPPEPLPEPLPDTIDQQLFGQQLRGAIDQLSEAHKQCFVLRYQEELTVAEIAEIAGCPEGTVKSRLHTALRKVMEQMEEWRVL
jgi:RNA polymerase sigma-70 factor (ECF subfamily)